MFILHFETEKIEVPLVLSITHHHGCPGHRTPVKTFAEEKTGNELY
jgi:hypothetical protein